MRGGTRNRGSVRIFGDCVRERLTEELAVKADMATD